MSVTYTLNQQPVARGRYDGASTSARITSEIFERLHELDCEKLDQSAAFVRRLATLSDLSMIAYRMVLRVGAGEIEEVVASYGEQATRGRTRQSLHWEWQQEISKIRYVFPQVAELLIDYRTNALLHEGPTSAADGLRDAMRRDDE